ncbi:MAG: hypothetical protein K1X82_11250 [Bacteroidia bacterium]|nr:hypothetical protein [Bacteroidia bacterium]
MKKLVFTLLILFPFLSSKAQIGHDLTIFSGDGMKFTVIINGMKMNEQPQTNVFIENLNNDWVKAKIFFEDTNLEPIERNILQIKSAANSGNYPEAVVYEIRTNKKGQPVLRWSSAAPKKIQQQVIIQQAPAPAPPQPGIQINVPGVQMQINTPQ